MRLFLTVVKAQTRNRELLNMRPDTFPRTPANAVVVALAIVLLAGCATTDSAINRYVLPRAATPPVAADVGARVLRLAQPQLSGLLDRRGLLLQTSDIQVHVASQHQWAEDLAPQLQQRLLQQLSAQLPTWQLQPAEVLEDGALLSIWVEQFQGRFDGQAVVSGRWQLRDKQHKVLQTKDFLFEESLPDDGYPALVFSLGQAWNKLAEQIAQALNTVAL